MKYKGFTFIELLLYISIAAVLILVIAIFLQVMLASRVKNQAITEVEAQGVQVLQRFTQTVRNAENINLPLVGTSAVSLSIDVVTAANDPTIFDLSNGAIRIQEGAGSPVALINSRVTASGLTFQNLSRAGTPGTIRATFTLNHINPSGRNEYEYSKTFYGSASLR